jgi:predicted nucleic acid-binding protein
LRVVVDTNVVSYFLLDTEPFSRDCRAFWRKGIEALAPVSWEAELLSVLWQAYRAEALDAPGMLRCLDRAKYLGIRPMALGQLLSGALLRACQAGVSPYDALFVEVAHREGVPLVTYDKKVLKTFPDIATTPSAL